MAAFLDVKITQAGIAAAFNAASTGIDLVLTDIAFGALSKVPDGSEMQLVREIKRVPIEGGSRVLDDQIRVWGLWSSDTDDSDIREIGIYSGNILFAYYARPDGGLIGRKIAGGDFVFYYDFKLSQIPSGSVTVQIDPNANVALMAIKVHENDLMAHNHFLRRAEVAQTAALYRWAGLAGGTPDVIELTLPAESLLTSYQPGQTFRFIARAGNTGSVALRVNGLDLRSVRKNGSTALASGDIGRSCVYEVTFDGSNFQLQGSIGVTDGSEVDDGEVFAIHEFITTGGQTNFEVPYNIGALEVFYMGEIVPPARFVATDGANVTLKAPCLAGKEVVIITLRSVAASNVYTRPQTYNRSEVLGFLSQKQDNLGFSPVQQGGGVGQLSNKLRFGWDGGKLLAQVDAFPLGNLWYSGNFDPALKANAPKIREISANVVLTAQDAGLILVDCSGGPVTVNLPLASDGVLDFTIRRVDNTANRLEVRASGADKVRFHSHLSQFGYPFFVLMGAGDWWRVLSSTTNTWWPMGRLDDGALGRPVFETTIFMNPGGWGLMNGELMSRAEWPWLWDHAVNSRMVVNDASRIGYEGSWSNGDGLSTFRKPEIRGEFLRVASESRDVDFGRYPGTSQASDLQSHEHAARQALGLNSTTGSQGLAAFGNPSVGSPVVSGAVGPAGGTETRPRNIAYPARIKLI